MPNIHNSSTAFRRFACDEPEWARSLRNECRCGECRRRQQAACAYYRRWLETYSWRDDDPLDFALEAVALGPCANAGTRLLARRLLIALEWDGPVDVTAARSSGTILLTFGDPARRSVTFAVREGLLISADIGECGRRVDRRLIDPDDLRRARGLVREWDAGYGEES